MKAGDRFHAPSLIPTNSAFLRVSFPFRYQQLSRSKTLKWKKRRKYSFKWKEWRVPKEIV